MKLEYAARVSIGPLQSNDDRVLIDGQILDDCLHSGAVEAPALAVVCDGCGGYSGGYLAAETVLGVLAQEAPASLIDANYLAQVLEKCKQRVMEKKQEMPQFEQMCTTVAGCLFHQDGMVLFHAGDSRIYRCDEWGMTRMTKDHSLVQSFVDMGQITPEQALLSPQRNVINRCIGIECPPPDIYVSYAAAYPGEKYLFCSDGLWESVSEAKMEEILTGSASLAEMADALMEYSLQNGASDNVSVLICTLQEEAPDAPVTESTDTVAEETPLITE